MVVNGDYIWKYTHNGYDFSVLGATPVTFPIEWKNSKIPGFAIGANLTQTHGFTAFVTLSSVAARFFSPQIGGLGTTVGQVPGPSASITTSASIVRCMRSTACSALR